MSEVIPTVCQPVSVFTHRSEEPFIAQGGGVRAYAGVMKKGPLYTFSDDHVVIEIDAGSGPRALARLGFVGPDASLFVKLSYFGATRAVMGGLRNVQQDASGFKYDFHHMRKEVPTPEGVSHVKLTHHATSGLVDFNLYPPGGAREPGPKRPSFRLRDGEGQVCRADVFHLPGLRPAQTPKRGNLHVQFHLGSEAAGAQLQINWQAVKGIAAARQHSTELVGPIADTRRVSDSAEHGVAFVTARPGRPHYGFIATVSVTAIASPANGTGNVMVALAGWDAVPGPPRPPEDPLGVCLGAMFVIDAASDSAKTVPLMEA